MGYEYWGVQGLTCRIFSKFSKLHTVETQKLVGIKNYFDFSR